VFPGEGGPWDEATPPNPSLLYGRSKRQGEEAVLGEDPGAAVVRVALVLGRGHGPRATASESVLWALGARGRVRLFTDQYRTPIDPESVAAALERLLSGAQSGIFHLGGPERLSRYEIGRRSARLAGLDASLIEAVLATDRSSFAQRPRDVSLDSGRAARELGWAPRPLDAAILESRSGPDESAR